MANAPRAVRQRCDLVTEGAAGKGVVELIDRLVGDDLASLEDLAGVQRHAIDFLSGRWFAWHDGRLLAGDTFLAVQPTGRDF